MHKIVGTVTSLTALICSVTIADGLQKYMLLLARILGLYSWNTEDVYLKKNSIYISTSIDRANV